MRDLPTVIASRDASRAIRVVELLGVGRLRNFDATGYQFAVELTPEAKPVQLVVVFSGTAFAYRPDRLGLPVMPDRETRFEQFALAAIGDALDEGDLVETDDEYAIRVDCYSPKFEEWRTRKKAGADEIRRYLIAHAYWSFEFDAGPAVIGIPDWIRLGRHVRRLKKEADLYQDDLWEVEAIDPFHFRVTALPELVRNVRSGEAMEPQAALNDDGPGSVEDDVSASPVSEETAAIPYVDSSRIDELRRIESDRFDLSRVIAICEELNHCSRSQCFIAVAALVRALIDHVPPIFGKESFTEVANHHRGKSFKECALRLDGAGRSVGDLNLHQQIRRKESLPTRVQVDFRSDLDVLLSELIVQLHPGQDLRVGD